LQALLRAAPAVNDEVIADLEARTGLDVQCEAVGRLVSGGDLERLAAWLGDDVAHRRVTAAAEEPAVREDGPALFLPGARRVRSHLLARAFLAGARARGAELHEHRRVLALRPGGVETETGPVDADRTLVCAGAWASGHVPGAGVEPVRGQILLYRTAPARIRRMVVFATGEYVVPRRDGVALFGSTLERAGFDARPTEDAVTRLAGRAMALLGLAPGDRLAAWAGLRPATASLLPPIGRHPSRDDLFLACGHYRNGILLAGLTARMISDLLAGRPSAFETGPFSPPR
jgi:glycine oxidase